MVGVRFEATKFVEDLAGPLKGEVEILVQFIKINKYDSIQCGGGFY